MTKKKTRRVISAEKKAAIALEALREGATVPELAQKHQVHATQIYACKKQLLENAAAAFDPKLARDAENEIEKERDELFAKIGQLSIERDFFSKEVRTARRRFERGSNEVERSGSSSDA